MDEARRLAFGGVAELYDRVRPSYPQALVEDVLSLAPQGSSSPALEVGAGTGKATVMFAARGVGVHALEPSAEMAAIAQRNCARYPEVTIERSDFERWQPPPAQFGLLYCAQAWHWVSPQARYAKARAVLAPRGLLAVFWNRPDWESCPLREEIDDAYARTAPELLGDAPMRPCGEWSGQWARWPEEIDAAEGFELPEVRHSGSTDTAAASTRRSCGLTPTHIVLEPAKRDALCFAVEEVIDRRGGVLALTYLTGLCLARAAA